MGRELRLHLHQEQAKGEKLVAKYMWLANYYNEKAK